MKCPKGLPSRTQQPLHLTGHVLDAILGRLVAGTPCAGIDYLGKRGVIKKQGLGFRV